MEKIADQTRLDGLTNRIAQSALPDGPEGAGSARSHPLAGDPRDAPGRVATAILATLLSSRHARVPEQHHR